MSPHTEPTGARGLRRGHRVGLILYGDSRVVGTVQSNRDGRLRLSQRVGRRRVLVTYQTTMVRRVLRFV